MTLPQSVSSNKAGAPECETVPGEAWRCKQWNPPIQSLYVCCLSGCSFSLFSQANGWLFFIFILS